MKKFLLSLFILLLAGTAVFILGWINLRVPEGQWGLLHTKTQGYHNEAIRPEFFVWRWEALLPTVLELRTLPYHGLRGTVTLEGSLPSSELYGSLVSLENEFRYEQTLHYEALPSEALFMRLSRNYPQDSDPLESWRETLEALIQSQALDRIRNDLENRPLFINLDGLGEQILQTNTDLENLVLEPGHSRFPDLALYAQIRNSYQEILGQRLEPLGNLAAVESQMESRETARIQWLRRYGELLTDYPGLIELLNYDSPDPRRSRLLPDFAILENLSLPE